MNGYPDPPWQLEGELTIVPTRDIGGVLLADYRGGALRYRELIVFSGPTTRGMVVSHIYVDSEASLRGGHEIWGLPKELAEFELTPRTFMARQDGRLLLRAHIRRRRGFLPLRIPCPIVTHKGSTVGSASIKAAPALVTIESPFAHLNGTRLGLAGDDLRLTMPAPR